MKIKVCSIHASRNVKVFISFNNTSIASCFGFVLFFFILFRTLLLAALGFSYFSIGCLCR